MSKGKSNSCFGTMLQMFLLLLLGMFVGCGGGTTGTGGSGPIFSGRVLDEAGNPQGNVEVTVDTPAGTIAQGRTNADGSFSIQSPSNVTGVTLSFDSPSISAVAAVADIAPDTGEVAVNVTVAQSQPVAVIVDRVDSPRKSVSTPTARPSPTSEPNPGATPSPEPTATMNPVATPTLSPQTRFVGVVTPNLKRILISATMQINSAPAKRIDPQDGTFDFTLRRNLSGGVITFIVADTHIATVALPDLPNVPGKVSLGIRLDYSTADGTLTAKIGRFRFEPY